MANVLSKRVIQAIKDIGISFDLVEGVLDLPALAAVKVSMELGIPSVAHLHDIWHEECVDFGLIERSGIAYSAIRGFVSEVLRNADLIVVPSEGLKRYYEEAFNVSEKKIVYIPRGVPPCLEHKRAIEGPPKVIYSGSLSRHENLQLYIRSIPYVLKHEPRAEFYITGKGEQRYYLEKMSRDLGARIDFKWFDKKKDLHDFMSECTVGVIPWSDKISRRLGFPIKLLEYLSVGLPVVTTNIGGWTEKVTKNNLGLVTGFSPKEFAGGILFLIENPDFSYRCGVNGLEFVGKNYDIEKNSKLLLEQYNRLVG
jgi:glycosyltransferase involved in cell wall biosynthesis